MTDRDDFLAKMTGEVSRQKAVLAKRREDEAMAGQRIEEVVGRLRGIILNYNDWLKNNGFTTETTSTKQSLTLQVADTGKQPFKINFALGPEGTFYLFLQEPADDNSRVINLDDSIQVPVSDWSDHLFERELQKVVAEAVRRREPPAL